MDYKGLTLDKFQEDAIDAIHHNHSVIVSAPTGSGKTLIADYIINRDIKEGKRIVYTAPIKALSNQKYKEFSADYGEENVGLLTGDIVKNPHAPILIMTTEVYRNMVLSNDEDLAYISYVIFDEIHFINDIERGTVWEESIIFSKPEVRMLCLSATIPNAEEFAQWIEHIKGHDVVVIRHDVRNVPLHLSFYDSELGITTLDRIKEADSIPDYNYIRGKRHKRRPLTKSPAHTDLINEIKDKTPCLFFTFSRKGCQQKAKELAKKDYFPHDPRITAFIRKKLEHASPEINQLASAQLLRQILPFGIGFHHAGLIPLMKELVEELFAQGLIKVLYTTETFAVGINMPAKTACIEALRKYDGRNFRMLNSKEFFQIAGRAGRRGIDKEGFAYVMIDRRDFDYHKMKEVTDADKDPILSQFKLSVNTVLNLVDQHDTDEINQILNNSFYVFQKYGKQRQKKSKSHHTFEKLKKKLQHMGYVQTDTLTPKGLFASKIYTEEIVMTEIFATSLYKKLNEYQVLLVLACLCYEPRERTQFFKRFPSREMQELQQIIAKDQTLNKEKFFQSMAKLTALIDPCYHGKSIFDIIGNTSLLEGDLIRFFRQILDRIGQLKKATDDRELVGTLENCQLLITTCLKDIDVV